MLNHEYDLANSVMLLDDPFESEDFKTLKPRQREALHTLFDPWVQAARKLAVAAKRQVEEGGLAGTHAYDLIAAQAGEDAKVAETLIEMVAATVLHKLIEEEGGGRANVTFSPSDMDEMHKRYNMIVNRDGMTTEIKIEPRPSERASLKLSYDREGTMEKPASPQAEAKPEEPHWFAKIGGERLHAADKRSAENAVRLAISDDPTTVAEVENRRCPQSKCPAPTHIDNCMAAFCPNKTPK
jgi:hypothetical protein